MPTWLRVEAGQQAAQEVERLGADRAPPGALGLAVAARPALGRPRLDGLEAARVDPEQLVHRRAVGGAEVVVGVVAVAAGALDRLVVGDVAGRLLEVGGEPAALKDLREHVRDPLAGDVRAADLGDRVVAVADEDALVEARGALALDPVERPLAGRHVVGELLQEQAPQRPRVARIAGEERPLDRLGEVDEAEDGPVEVREMGLEQGALGVGEGLDRVVHGVADPSGGPGVLS